MENLNIPVTIKETEFSPLSSYKEHPIPRQFYIQVLLLKEKKTFFTLTQNFSENCFTKINIYNLDIKTRTSLRRENYRLKHEHGCKNPKNMLTKYSSKV